MDGCLTVKPGNVWVKTDHNLDYDGKPVMAKTIQYNDDLGSKDCKTVKWKEGKESPKQRKYITK